MPHFIDINDVSMYYDVSGSGCPLLLLHGAAQTGRRWESCVESLAEHFRVIVPDLRGHGRTNNPSRALSVELVSDDIAKFIEKMKLGTVLAWGFSFGCHVLLHLAIGRPHLLRALVAESCAAIPDDSLLEALENFKPELAQKYRIEDADLERITTPCLLMCGDRDRFFPLENVLKTYKHLPRGELFVMPNTAHGVREKCEGLVGKIVIDFLERHSGDVTRVGR